MICEKTASMRDISLSGAPSGFSHDLGHEDQFRPPNLNGDRRFRKETIAGMRRNGRDAPTAVIPE
jgi:hypothetical protein